MEPLAPGTEDEFQLFKANKKTTEQERLLAIKSYLPSGEYANVFELSYHNGSENWYCKICQCPIMGRVFHHESGKRHSYNMSMAHSKVKPNIMEKRDESMARTNEIILAPGEPVPPGYEDEVAKVTQIQDRLDSFKSGALLGLEYLLEIQDYDPEKEPSYLCIMCGKKGDPRTVIAHLVSYNHIQAYLQRHFPKTYQALSPYVTRQFKKNWQDTMNKISEAIEARYGRLKPHPLDHDTYTRDKDEIYRMIYSGPHFSEKNGITFEHLVDKEYMTKAIADSMSNESFHGSDMFGEKKKRSPSPPVVKRPRKPKPSTDQPSRRRSLSSVSSISSNELNDSYVPSKKTPEKRSNFRRDSRNPRNYRNHSPVQSRSRYEHRSRSRSFSPHDRYKSRDHSLPWQRSDYVKTRFEKKDKIRNEKDEEFKRLSAAIENDMQKQLKHHKVNPEKHPQYNDEWKIFWNKRYKELQMEGKDASKYDFKPEWIIYWNKKIDELQKEELKAKIDALRKRLGIPPQEPTPISFKISGKKKSGSVGSPTPAKPEPVAAQPDQDHEVIVIEDNDSDDKKRSRSPYRKRSRSPYEKRSRSPYEKRSRSPYENRSRSPYEKRNRSPHGKRYPARSSAKRGISLDRVSSDRELIPPPKNRERYSREKSWDRRSDLRSREKSWERDIKHHREKRKDPILEIYKPPPVMRDVTRNPVDYTRLPVAPAKSPELEDDGEINIVAILRLLTALEDKLGSLGPKIIDMLAAALAMEKKEANSSETLLDNEINCVLFETVKEKLKGALHAGLVAPNQERAYKIAIKKTASLLHLASTRKVEEKPNKQNVDPVKVPGIGIVDKAAIAKQIATALVLQGKTDVTHDELEQLINAVVGMAEASKNSDRPITTASFLQQLSSKPAEETVPEPKKQPTPSPPETESQNNMDGLSDVELQTLLQNFKDLSSEEQNGLITYLKKIEAKDPERVEKLRKFVTFDKYEEPVAEVVTKSSSNEGRISPFSAKLNVKTVPAQEVVEMFDDFEDDPKSEEENFVKNEGKTEKLKFDSDEEDYSYEDVFKAANQNVMEKKKEEESLKSKNEDILTDAKALIANIMGSIVSKSTPLGTTTISGSDAFKTELTTNPEPPQGRSSNFSANIGSISANTTSTSTARTQSFPLPIINPQQLNTDFRSNVQNPHPEVNVQRPFQSSGASFQRNPQNFVQYPVKPQNNPYGSNNFQHNFGNINYPNQFEPPRNRFNFNPRGGFNSNRGGGNFNHW